MLGKDKSNKYPNITWHSYRSNVILTEIVFIIVTVICIAMGILFDYEIQNNIIRFQVEEFKSYILTILGIQATVSTLTIALVALISNNISESYMGVSVSHYYLNIRPYIFKQNRIIYFSFILIGTSCILYVFELYNLLISIFAITIMLVFLSSYEIYFLFRGLQKAQEEIELYVSQNMKQHIISKKRYKKTSSIFSDFINDWTYKCGEQTLNEYQKYREIFVGAFNAMLYMNKPSNLLALNENCSKQILSFLQNDSDKIKARGIDLIVDTYETLWKYVISDEFNKENSGEFNLFGEVDYTLDEALKDMSLQLIGKTFSWEHLTDIVARTVFCLASDNANLRFSSDLQAVLRFSASIGSIAKFKEQYNKEPIDDIIAPWGRYLSRPYLDSAYNIPENRKQEYLDFKCRNYFYYCKGFIDNEYMDLVKENIFFRAISNSFYNIHKSEILYYLAIDCYLYYLSEKESPACVDVNLKTAAKQFLEDKRVINLNKYLFSKIERSVLEYVDLENDLQQMLQKCEWFPKYSNSKTMIMENVVREFYIFMQILMNNSYRYYKERNFKLSEPPFVYANQFLEGNEAHTKENLKRFYMLFQGQSNNANNEVEEMYSDLEDYLKAVYKDKEIKEAAEEQKKYIDTVDEESVIDNIQEKVSKHLESVVSGLNIKSNKKNLKWTAKFNLLNCDLFTRMINNDVVDSMYSDVIGALGANIINELFNRKLINKISRKEFKDDDEYLSFLKEKNIKTLIGSEYVFKNSDYRNEDKFKTFFNDLQCIFYGFYHSGGVALKDNSVKVNIKNVKISIRPVSLDADKYTPDENDIISYNVTNDIIIPFHKDEFMVYINNKRKLLSVSIEVEFIARKDNVGVYIVRNDD